MSHKKMLSFSLFTCALVLNQFHCHASATNFAQGKWSLSLFSLQNTDLAANCGPAVLKKVFDSFDVKSDFSELIIATNTRMGKTTMKDMADTLSKKGFCAAALSVSYDDLKNLLKTHTVIAYVNKNSHYIIRPERRFFSHILPNLPYNISF